MTITCCYGCKPPKRTPTCHATCPEYAELEQTNKAKMTHYNIRSQTGDGVRRANKRKKL